jgi:hypothetical protein
VNAVVEAVGADRLGIRFAPWSLHGAMSYVVSPLSLWAYVTTACSTEK